LKEIESLESLVLNYGEFTDKGLEYLSQLRNLKQLEIYDSLSLSGKRLGSLTRLAKLEVLSLSTRNLSDADIAEVAQIKSLKSLSLFNTTENLTNNSLTSIGQLKGLTRLRISGDFTDKGLIHLEGLKSLRSLRIRPKRGLSKTAIERLEARPKRGLSKTAIERLEAALPNLKKVDCNKITEDIPKESDADVDDKETAGEEDRLLFFKAVREGRFEAVRKYLAGGVDIDARRKDGWTALHMATESRATDVVRLLVKSGADINAKELDGETPLHRAAYESMNSWENWKPEYEQLYKRSVEIAEILIAAGADINAQTNDGRTPLIILAQGLWTVRFVNIDIFKLLIDSGADVNVRPRPERLGSRTSLIFAVKADKVEVARILLEAGADPLGAVSAGDDFMTTLDIAEQKGSKEMIQLLGKYVEPRLAEISKAVKSSIRELLEAVRRDELAALTAVVADHPRREKEIWDSWAGQIRRVYTGRYELFDDILGMKVSQGWAGLLIATPQGSPMKHIYLLLMQFPDEKWRVVEYGESGKDPDNGGAFYVREAIIDYSGYRKAIFEAAEIEETKQQVSELIRAALPESAKNVQFFSASFGEATVGLAMLDVPKSDWKVLLEESERMPEFSQLVKTSEMEKRWREYRYNEADWWQPGELKDLVYGEWRGSEKARGGDGKVWVVSFIDIACGELPNGLMRVYVRYSGHGHSFPLKGTGPETEAEVGDSFGRVEGRVFIGHKVGAGETIWLHPYEVDVNDGSVELGKGLKAIADSNGHFVFEKVPQGWADVGRLIQTSAPPLPRKSYSHSYSNTSRRQIEVIADETVNIAIGGEGRPVIGRFALPANYDKTIDLSYGIRSLTSDWDRRDINRLFSPEFRHFAFAIDHDGTFRIEDVPAGKYQLYVSIENLPINEELRDIAGYSGVVEIPETIGGRTEEPFDLGTFELKLSDAETESKGSSAISGTVDEPDSVEKETLRYRQAVLEGRLPADLRWTSDYIDGPASDVTGAWAGQGKLEFRVVPNLATDVGSLNFKELSDTLGKIGPEPKMWKNWEYKWVQLHDSLKAGDIAKGYYEGKLYGMLSDEPNSVMSADGWALVDVSISKDTTGRPSVKFEFDAKGAELLGELTRGNIDRRLAIVVDDRVISAPRILAVITKAGMITGSFSTEEAQRIAATLRKGMVKTTENKKGG